MDAITAVFPQSITQRIVQAVQQHPDQQELLRLFGDIAALQTAVSRLNIVPTNGKKRKLDDGPPYPGSHANGTVSASASAVQQPVLCFECADVSIQMPARKKLAVQFVRDAQDARKQEVRLRNAQGEVEHTLPVSAIDQVFCLPVPEKQQRQWNFVVLPKLGAMGADATPCEQIVFTMNVSPVKGVSASQSPVQEDDTFVTVTEREWNLILRAEGKQVIIPDEAEFASSVPQPHRKGEKAYHVKAHRGSKEGYMFFLPVGIVFGFKKPLAYFPFSSIDSISYTSVLQRTFNLVIAARTEEHSDVTEHEFSMLDQADFPGIDEYVKRHELNDASMAAARRAKAFNVNKEKKGSAGDDAASGPIANGSEEHSELQKAEQQLQDEEDELEEDYEVSGGESDGEGDYSDDEEEEYGDAADEEGAEDVEHEEDVEDE